MRGASKLRRKVVPVVCCFGYRIGGTTTIVVLLSILLLFVIGCGSTTMHVSRAGTAPWPGPSQGKDILAYKEGETIDRNYEVIGNAFVFRVKRNMFSTSNSEKNLTKLLKAEAAARGADAIIGVHSSDTAAWRKGKGFGRFAGALLVRFTEGGPDEVSIPDFVIAILPVLDENLAVSKHSPVVRDYARYLLENARYYATAPQIDSPIQFSDLEHMGTEAMQQIGGRPVRNLLLITTERVEEEQRVVFKGAQSLVRARLISKDTGSVIWEGEGAGSFAAGWLLALGTDEAEQAMFPALRSALESFPLYRGLETSGSEAGGH
jgi:hypothetical protein